MYFLMLALAFADPAFVIRNVNVFDGEKFIGRKDVAVVGGKIAAQAPEGSVVIDGTGKTLLPGLIDAHTHTFAADNLKQAVVFGVTTELDMFTDPKMAAALRAGGGVHADLRSAGMLATVPGGHGTEYPIKVPTLSKPEEAEAWVAARIKEGSDYIKIIYDGGAAYSTKIPTLDLVTLRAIIAAAHSHGKMAVVHIGTLAEARDALEAGADGLMHLFGGPSSAADFGTLAARHKAFVVPTLSVLSSGCGTKEGEKFGSDPRIAARLPRSEAANVRRGFSLGGDSSCKGAEQAVGQLKAAGVPLLTGSDAPNPGTTHGATVHEEMELLVKAGLTPVEALRAATSAPARAFHLDDRGRIEPGLRADLVLVDGDPAGDITATRGIAAVWVRGEQVDVAAWDATIAKERADTEKRRQGPAPKGSEAGLISDFDGAKVTAQFGAGWVVTTDSMMGGKSVAEFGITAPGANGSAGALHVSGEIRPGYAYAWSGVMFSPGAAPMAPANLSSKKTIRFRARGDGGTFRLMVFAASRGYMPISKPFVAGAEWKEFQIAFAEMEGIDGSDIMAFIWCGGPAAGKFEFWIDDVRVE